MKKKHFLMASSLALVVVLAACSDKEDIAPESEVKKEEVVSEQPTTPSVAPTEPTESVKEEAKEEVELVKTEPTEPAKEGVKEPVKEAVKPVTETPKAPVVASGDAAVELLKGKLEEGSNGDIIFGATETTEADEKGNYYTVRLSSLSLRLAGGTGTLENYKVYEDGSFSVY